MRTYKKFFLWLTLGALIGALLGLWAYRLRTFFQAYDVLKLLNDRLMDNMVYLYIGFTLIYLLSSFGLFYWARSHVKKQIQRDEDLIDDTGLSISLGWGTVGYFISLVMFVISVPRAYKLGPSLVKLSLGLIFLSIFLFFILQKKIVDFIKTYNPEKEGDVMDLNFNKKWIESSDERERQVQYQAGYKAYRLMSGLCLVALTILCILTFETSYFLTSLILTLVIYIGGIISFIYNEIKLNKTS